MNANAQTFVPTSTGTPNPTLDVKLNPSSLRDNTNHNNNNKSLSKQNNQQKHRQQRQSIQQNQKQQSRHQQHQRNYNQGQSSQHVRQPRNYTHSLRSKSNDAAEMTKEEPSTDKKGRVSLNHLLNFSFPERRTPQSYSNTRRSNKQLSSGSSSPYNKERFVNANFRFLVNPTGGSNNNKDYTFHLADPDSRFEWTDIEQVLISANGEVPTCPICLSPPTAARVTKCGHTFCLPCMLHYLELRENPKKQWRKCPICWDPVYERDFKPVQILHTFAIAERGDDNSKKITSVTEGDKVDMSLVMRTNGSTLALPVSSSWPVPDSVVDGYLKPGAAVMPWHFTPDAMQFARFMLVGPDYLLDEYEHDRQGLLDAMKEAKEWNLLEEIPFIERAMIQIDEKINEIKRQNTKQVELAMHTAKMLFDTTVAMTHTTGSGKNKNKQTILNTPDNVDDKSSNDDDKKKNKKQEEEIPMSYQQYHSQRAGEDTEVYFEQQEQGGKSNNNNTTKQKSISLSSGSTLDYYFFQASDGQHIYLHPLDVRVLKHEYGDFERFPHHLQVHVESVEETTMTEEVRKRFKYLSHLPLACDVTFLEVDLKKLVSNETSKAFSNELKMRAKKKQDQVRREEKSRKVMEAREKKERRTRDDTHRRIMESDPFFFHNSQSIQENEAMLAKAITESAKEQEQQLQQQQNTQVPKTVWGTKAVASKEEIEAGPSEWADHIVVTTKKKKNKYKQKK